jgi:hypothetical protein
LIAERRTRDAEEGLRDGQQERQYEREKTEFYDHAMGAPGSL